ncbi:MAG: FtsX-like permease family protein [Deltaproteobacteria bacterium]|nr:FtsX-like permease family protein [Deltaproteobacteria bacterium]
MTLVGLTRVVGQNIWRNSTSLSISAIGIAAGIALFGLFLALVEQVRNVVEGDIVPIDQVEVIPLSSDLQRLAGSLFGEDTFGLSDDDVRTISRIPGVVEVLPRMNYKFSGVSYGGKALVGSEIRVETIADGIPPEQVAEELINPPVPFEDRRPLQSNRRCRFDTDCPRGEYCEVRFDGPPAPELADTDPLTIRRYRACALPVPTLLSRYLLEFYNTVFAPGHGYVQLNEGLLRVAEKELQFTTRLGDSFMGPQVVRWRQRNVRMQITGVSEKSMDLGVTFPIEYVRDWNDEYAGTKGAARYSSVSVRAASKEDVSDVIRLVREKGFDIKSRIAEQVSSMVEVLGIILLIISLIVITIAGFNIMHTFLMLVLERRREIGLFRAIGATRANIRNVFLLEAAFIGLLSGVLGLLLAYSSSLVFDTMLITQVPQFPYKPATFFDFRPWIVATAIGFAVVFTVVGAFLPSLRAARLDPVRALQ